MMDFEIINGNCLDVLKRFPLGYFDACVADPPYCSGGVTPSSIGRGGANKYVQRTDLGNFADGMTQRAFYRFTVEWLSLARKRLASPGYCFVFIDWGTADAYKAAKIVSKGVINCPAPPPDQRIHPTQKAVEVFERLFDVLPDTATRVVDPFCGSASSGVAALRRGLSYVGIDESARYCDAARGRLQTTLERFRATGEVVDAHRAQRTLWEPLAGRETG